MKLSAYRNNVLVSEIDLLNEVSSQAEAFFLIGRSETCHLMLDDKKVSREHAQINYVNGKWSITQLTKFGVVIINGMAMPEKELTNGDMVMIGPFMIHISVEIQQEIEEETTNDLETEVMAPPEELSTEQDVEKEEESFEVSEDNDVDENSFIREDDNEIDEETSDENAERSNEEVSEFDDKSEEHVDGFGDKSEEHVDGFGDKSEEHVDGFGDETEDFGSEDESGFNDDEFSDDSDSEGFDDDEGTKVLQSFARFELIIEGEHAPYDRYVVENGETLIGRDVNKCQIVLGDPEVSGIHASITKNNVLCTLKDLQSGNGTILNGSRINQIELTNGDEFIIGSTTFTVTVASSLLQEEENRLMPVEENQEIEVEEEVEVGADFGDGDFEEDDADGGLSSFGEGSEVESPKSLVGKFKLAWQDPGKRKKIIYIVVGLVLAWVMLSDDPKPKITKTKEQIAKEKAAKKKSADAKKTKTKKNHSPETLQQLEAKYLIAKKLTESGQYEQALVELDFISSIDEEYKNTKGLIKFVKSGFDQLEEIERKRREEEQLKIRKAKIRELVKEAVIATKDRNVPRAEALFGQVLEIDPENFDVPTLKNELDAWKKEQERIALEEAQKKADRKRKISQLAPGKKYYLQKDWHKAILKLDDFLGISNMDEDLVKEATTMLKDANGKLEGEIAPRLGRARSLKEGKDDKGAYAQYKEILKVDPTNREALDEMNEILESLTNRARRVYRDALISESLSLFDEAKEKFNEVKQISPTDGEYYKKADDRLKDYLE